MSNHDLLEWSSYSDDSYDSEFKYLIYIYMYD